MASQVRPRQQSDRLDAAITLLIHTNCCPVIKPCMTLHARKPLQINPSVVELLTG
jgi:hypothetical protein